jgi:hypothetical protein
MESGPVSATDSVYTTSGGGQQPSHRPGKGHSRMAHVMHRKFPRPTFHAAPVQHGEPPLSDPSGVRARPLRLVAMCHAGWSVGEQVGREDGIVQDDRLGLGQERAAHVALTASELFLAHALR